MYQAGIGYDTGHVTIMKDGQTGLKVSEKVKVIEISELVEKALK